MRRLQVLEGRYGPYVTDGEINASVPKGMDPATLSLDDARALLEARRGAAAASAGADVGVPRRSAARRQRDREARGAESAAKAVRKIGCGARQSRRAESAARKRALMAANHRRRARGIRGRLAGRVARRAVTLYEMRPVRPTAVHKTDRLAELVCSNSFRGDKLDNAVGLLKEEMRRLGSLVMRAAEDSRVPAGAALAVDRERFAQIDHRSRSPSHPLITHLSRRGRRDSRSPASASPVIVATGPLTSEALSADIARLVGSRHLYFYDAISPIVLAETIDRDEGIPASRWDRSLDRCSRCSAVAKVLRTLVRARPAASTMGRATT